MSAISVATYNAALLPGTPTGLGWVSRCFSFVLDAGLGRKRIRAMLKAMAAEGVQVVCLQEVWDTIFFRWSRVLEEEAESLGYYVVAAPIPFGSFINSGLAILTKFLIADTSSHTFAASAGIQWLAPKGFQHVALLDGSSLAGYPCYETFHVINTHIHASSVDTALCNSPAKSIRTQHQQIMQISDHVRRNILGTTAADQREFTPLVILAGDFNVDGGRANRDGGSGTSETDKDLDAGTLPFSWLESHFRLRLGMHHPLRFPTSYPFRSHPVSNLVDQRVYSRKSSLDHIFSTRPFGQQPPRTMTLYDSEMRCYDSDHAPVLVLITN